MSKKGKGKEFCAILKYVKFPNSYASNVSWCISMNDGNMTELKSCDHYVILQISKYE